VADIVRSPAAEDDLIEIWCTIALDSPAAADRLLDTFASRIEHLAAFPDLGPERPDIGEAARLSVGNYLVLYRHIGGQIEIVRVVHGARDLTALL
jgi:toxin ParE1/3/4